jgi:hypothetical protein
MVSIWLTKIKDHGKNADMKKTGLAERSRFSSNATDLLGLLPILLDPGGAQPGQTMLVDRELPGKEFVNGQRVTAAGFLKGKQAAADRSYDLGLAADDPPFGSGRRQVGNR